MQLLAPAQQFIFQVVYHFREEMIKTETDFIEQSPSMSNGFASSNLVQTGCVVSKDDTKVVGSAFLCFDVQRYCANKRGFAGGVELWDGKEEVYVSKFAL